MENAKSGEIIIMNSSFVCPISTFLSQRLLIGLKKLDVVRENSYKRFEDALPTGVRVMMNDEAYDR